ncbi:hypothetical protein VitviT2T_018629 [Vitis vinifera]|uniref:NB-ARC domain-containing protein n=1 Tax=Vitis vinifera TaxID=29760 RepID=A0ABY9CY07_VITVI|nr:putative disease resistance protein RGA3 [Vitis vinifera]WKA00250.1 hypothetical protein VitviT2T_018629 [Vitis vinifera]|eukprot:XP_019078955.1 PREDICTED: putative disease resistance protein RGA3 [Vitis vinifera]
MGGIGKTTVTQLVYNDRRVEECFDLKAWVCVSDEFDLVKIMKTILKAINSGTSNDNDLNLLQLKLKESHSREKFLLILDDVWNEDYINRWVRVEGKACALAGHYPPVVVRSHLETHRTHGVEKVDVGKMKGGDNLGW